VDTKHPVFTFANPIDSFQIADAQNTAIFLTMVDYAPGQYGPDSGQTVKISFTHQCNIKRYSKYQTLRNRHLAGCQQKRAIGL